MRFRHLLAAMAVLVGVASCGDGDADVATEEITSEVAAEGERATVTLRFTEDVSQEDRQTTVAVLDARLHDAGLTDSTVEADADRVTVEVLGTGADDADSIAGLLTEPGTLELRPVLATVPPAATPSCAADGSAPSSGDLLPQFDGPGEGPTSCYDLGPSEATGAIIADATAEEGGAGQWQIAIQLRPGPDGVDIFNAVAASCFDRGSSCPSGQLAIVLDGVVLSAPTIQQPTFNDRGISLTGQFTAAEADRLAIVLRSGALPVGLTVDQEGQG